MSAAAAAYRRRRLRRRVPPRQLTDKDPQAAAGLIAATATKAAALRIQPHRQTSSAGDQQPPLCPPPPIFLPLSHDTIAWRTSDATVVALAVAGPLLLLAPAAPADGAVARRSISARSVVEAAPAWALAAAAHFTRVEVHTCTGVCGSINPR